MLSVDPGSRSRPGLTESAFRGEGRCKINRLFCYSNRSRLARSLALRVQYMRYCFFSAHLSVIFVADRCTHDGLCAAPPRTPNTTRTQIYGPFLLRPETSPKSAKHSVKTMTSTTLVTTSPEEHPIGTKGEGALHRTRPCLLFRFTPGRPGPGARLRIPPLKSTIGFFLCSWVSRLVCLVILLRCAW